MPHQDGTHFKGPIYSGGDKVLVEGDSIPVSGGQLDAASIADGSVSDAEFQYLKAVTSDIQAQLDALAQRLTNGSL